MLHTMFRGIRSTDSGEDGFKNDFTIFGYGGNLCHAKLSFTLHMEAYHQL